MLSAVRAATLGAVAATLLLCGAAAGEARLAAIDAPAERIRDGERVELRAHLLTPPRPSPVGASAEVAVTRGRLRGVRLLVRAARWAPLPGAVRIGEELRLEGRLQPLTTRETTAPAPSGAADDRSDAGSAGAAEDLSGAAAADGASFDFPAYLRRRGVAGELLLDRARRTGRQRDGL